MGKVIIDNQSDLSDIEAMDMVATVMTGGRVSNDGKQYCYATTFTVDHERYAVYTDLNKKSDKFLLVAYNLIKGEG